MNISFKTFFFTYEQGSTNRRPGQVTCKVGQVTDEQKAVRGLVHFLVLQVSLDR